MAARSFLPLRRMPPAPDPFALRVSQIAEGNPRGEYVLYHARAARRARNNLALDYAKTLGKRVVMAEWLDEPHLSPRIEAFLRNGAERTAREADVEYLFEPDLEVLTRARFVVTDEFPTLPTPPHATHLVDHNGVLPMRALGKEQYSARFFRDKAFKLFEQFRSAAAKPPLWEPPQILKATNISAQLHFGHLGINEILTSVLERDDADDFLEQAVIRRELSFNLCFYNPSYATLKALPEWAKQTLAKHRNDRRKPVYTYEQFERAETHDDVWNLSQRQLLATGTIHNYLRMLWGKKIIEWSATPEDAHATMLRLHDVHALDGRDPNTHAGILWCFGKHDRPFVERPIFGKVRWMSSEQTRKKVRLPEIAASFE
jgi:deoxyribodipyrimidine photolyase